MPYKIKIHEIADSPENYLIRYKLSQDGIFWDKEHFINLELKIPKQEIEKINGEGIKNFIQEKIIEKLNQEQIEKILFFNNLKKLENEEFEVEDDGSKDN